MRDAAMASIAPFLRQTGPADQCSWGGDQSGLTAVHWRA